MEDNIEIALEIVQRNLDELKAAEEEDERLRAMQNLLASVNTLVAYAYRHAEDEVDGAKWVAKQQHSQLNDLLADVAE